jgi:hypothetical protein
LPVASARTRQQTHSAHTATSRSHT